MTIAQEVTTIGLDLAKNVFQVHGVDLSGETVLRRQLRRRQVIPFFKALAPCLIGLEACATSHHWARTLQVLGHEVRIMPANYVKAYVKRNKNDAADAQAICEAVTRPTMRFVAISDPSLFTSGRELAAWIGLVPKQNSSGGKDRLGRISKQGDPYLRWLLVAGAMSVIRQGRKTGFANNPWLADLMQRKPTKVAAVALANKNARTAWAVLVSGEAYRRPAVSGA